MPRANVSSTAALAPFVGTGSYEDPEYPLYHYSLACADAEEKDLAAAQKHLREAFDREANVLAGEKISDLNY
jgi:hypothetical protein